MNSQPELQLLEKFANKLKEALQGLTVSKTYKPEDAGKEMDSYIIIL